MKKIFDSYLKEKYSYETEKAVMSKKSGKLTLYVRLNFIVPWKELDDVKSQICQDIPGVRNVKFVFAYRDMAMDENEIMDLFIEYMINIANGKYKAVTKTIYPHEFRTGRDTLEIYALGQTAVRKLNEQVADMFSALLEKNFGIRKKVVFLNHEEAYEKTFYKMNNMREETVSDVKMASKTAVSDSRQRKQSSRILGKEIKDEIVRMIDLSESSGEVAVEGVVFEKNCRTVRNSKKLVTIFLSDGSSSVCAKLFTSEKKWKEIDDSIKEEDTVRIKGNIEWDDFSKSIVLLTKNIQKCQKRTREDNAVEKRVELHAHTKMSAMDGFNDPKKMVEMAAQWGHKAVAVTDHGVVQAFPEVFSAARAAKNGGEPIKIIYGVEGYIFDDKDCQMPDGSIDYRKKKTNHVIILARTQQGLKNLYRLISDSHIKYFYKKPRIPKSVLSGRREGLIVGSACVEGEVYQAVLNDLPEEQLSGIVRYYDYLEIQPLVNNQFLVDKGTVSSIEDIKDMNRKIIALGDRYGRPVAATCDTHYTEPEDSLYRQILMAGQGYKDIEGDKGLYFRTTDEMLAEFGYLDEETAYRVVVKTPGDIADSVEDIRPVPKEKFPPSIPDADNILRSKCEKRAAEIYGGPLPEVIRDRLEKELDSIIGNGYAVMYVAAAKLVEKSLDDGYLVGSRGSVGSSLAATMAGITEVNPLPAHYICPKCKKLEWGDEKIYDCGIDMPEKNCPECGTKMDQDGYTIPFETFLGFEGDKEPDIDLNFAGEYQSRAHKYVEEIFGSENVYRAGTIGTIAGKTAYGFVMKYFEDRGIPVNKYEADRLAKCCTGVRRTTGQHPGGIIIVPEGHDIHEFCPVQHPANDASTDTVTTHFDYHAIDKNLLKLDILGHDIPSMIRQLQDMTGVDPLKVPLKDARVMGIFNGTEGLDIKEQDYRFVHGSFGIPEFGTRFVRQMLDDTHPDKFADLVRISGFSHGTNVWINNAQEFIRNGQATMNDAISTRDDIMNYLILKGLPEKDAFTIMEKVRKGKGLDDEQAALMSSHGVPDWYIESCRRISYMFPRAHAVAYVMMSYRIAYYKVYYPAEFYAVYFTTKVADFNWEVIKKGSGAVLDRIDSLGIKGRNITKKEEDEITVLEVAYEMYSRGYEFSPPVLGRSRAVHFTISEGRILIPLCALDGVGENAGKAIEEACEERPFATVDELRDRTKINKTAVESLRAEGVLADMQESDQMSFF